MRLIPTPPNSGSSCSYSRREVIPTRPPGLPAGPCGEFMRNTIVTAVGSGARTLSEEGGEADTKFERSCMCENREPGVQALTAGALGRTCCKGEAPASTASERASAALGRRSAGLHIMIIVVSYSDLSKSKTRSARFLISAGSTERNVVQQGLRRRALRRRDLRRLDLRRRRAAVLSGPARHGSRSGSTSCREGNRACR